MSVVVFWGLCSGVVVVWVVWGMLPVALCVFLCGVLSTVDYELLASDIVVTVVVMCGCVICWIVVLSANHHIY